jgi:hypothetical protein
MNLETQSNRHKLLSRHVDFVNNTWEPEKNNSSPFLNFLISYPKRKLPMRNDYVNYSDYFLSALVCSPNIIFISHCSLLQIDTKYWLYRWADSQCKESDIWAAGVITLHRYCLKIMRHFCLKSSILSTGLRLTSTERVVENLQLHIRLVRG